MGEWLLSRRDRLTVARHGVAGLKLGHFGELRHPARTRELIF
jgi:hypothetical protein